LLMALASTDVVAINFGENDYIIDCKPLEALIQHLNKNGKIRRYFIESRMISKKQRRESGLFSALRSARLKDYENPYRSAALWLRLNTVQWKAIEYSKAAMGKLFVKEGLALLHKQRFEKLQQIESD
jgi:hypothetical protein